MRPRLVFRETSETPENIGARAHSFKRRTWCWRFGSESRLGRHLAVRRVGDWVGINGVPGEVVNVSLFRTTLLETGSPSEKGRHMGRPAGRTITLLNSFAIKGQYFNFSTSGQWMWDEIRIAVPADRGVQSVLEEVRIAVTRETAKNFELTASEWSRLQRHFPAEPAVDLRPGSGGVDLVVRYVTRAAERFDFRNRLYQCLIDVLRMPATSG